MSFDQLPNEMIALVASHMDFFDIPQLLQSQKRVCRIIKEYKMDKPAFEEMKFTFTYRGNGWIGMNPSPYNTNNEMTWKLICHVKETNNTEYRMLMWKIYEQESWNDVLDVISKTRSINSLLICGGFGKFVRLTEEVVTRFNLLNAKIQKCTLDQYSHMLSDDSFIRFCKNFSSVGLISMVVVNNLINEHLLSRILSVTKLHDFHPGLTVNVSQMFTKDTFEAAILSKQFYNFQFEYNLYLTVDEVRFLVESVIEKRAVFRMGFGLLAEDQLNAANVWFKSVEQNPHHPYKVESILEELAYPRTIFKITFDDSVAEFKIWSR